MEPNKTKEHLKCELTEAEIKQLGYDLARKYSEITDLEENKKAVSSDFKSQIDAATALASSMSRKIQNGYEFRDVECEIRRDYARKIIEWVRLDTGEIFKDRIMTADELQEDLFENDDSKVEIEIVEETDEL